MWSCPERVIGSRGIPTLAPTTRATASGPRRTGDLAAPQLADADALPCARRGASVQRKGAGRATTLQYPSGTPAR